MKNYVIHIGYDPSGVSWLGQDPEMTDAQRRVAFDKIESGEWEIYEVSLIETCPRHDWSCEQAIQHAVEGYIITENGHEGVYNHPGDVSETALKRVAEKLWKEIPS